tara:strand:- start:202 stop:486 length:285 start_codon:yes stop_codon:yes gene_type:complete
VTTISIVEVKASILKAQSTLRLPELIQLNKNTISVSTSPKYLMNMYQDNIAEINKKKVETIWEILSLKIFPKKIQKINPNKGNKTIEIIKILPL